MTWTPTLTEDDAPIYQRLVRALASDVAAGVLARGSQRSATWPSSWDWGSAQ